MLRIEAIDQNRDEVLLKVEGWIVKAHVALLKTEVARHLARTERLVLDLVGVRNIDQVGMDLLRHWSLQGVVLKGGSLFIRTLLKNHGLA